jgi:hypothetical protein
MEHALIRDQRILAEFNEIPSDPAAARHANEKAAGRLRDLQRRIDEHLARD